MTTSRESDVAQPAVPHLEAMCNDFACAACDPAIICRCAGTEDHTGD